MPTPRIRRSPSCSCKTAWDERAQALVATRRPRGHGESHPALAHQVLGQGAFEFDTDRALFLGRGRSWSRPAGLATRRPLAGSTGNVLDPIFASRRSVELAAGESRRITFVLAAGLRVPTRSARSSASGSGGDRRGLRGRAVARARTAGATCALAR
jgi:cyclic beta-1,2-glucan synthetase